MRTLRLLPLALAPLLLTSCIAYTVGTTARPIPKGDYQSNLSAYFVPNGIEEIDGDSATTDEQSLAYGAADFEGRWGLSDKSDIGLRVPVGGVIVNYKRMLNAVNDPTRPAYAVLTGAGIVNSGNHAYVEGGFIASGAEDRRVPYGGVRAMHVMPISSGAVSDNPTAGVFGGLRLRVGESFSMSPELGVYYDHSALGLRDHNVIFIPSVTFHWH
jgi:hypothetical protein